MSNVTSLWRRAQDTRPVVIDRNPYWCLMHVAAALRGLADLTALEMNCGSEEQLNQLMRADLSGLFTVLADYTDAARNAIPEETQR